MIGKKSSPLARVGTRSLVIAVAGVIAGLVAAPRVAQAQNSPAVDKRIQIIAGLLITGGSVAAVPFASTYPGFLAASAVFGLGVSLSTVATSAYTADVAKKEQIGSSMGALSSIMDIGQSSGPLVTGVIITMAGYTIGFFAGFVLALAVTGIFVFSVWGRDAGSPA